MFALLRLFNVSVCPAEFALDQGQKEEIRKERRKKALKILYNRDLEALI